MKPLQTGHISGVNLARITGAVGIIAFHYGCHNDFLGPFLRSSANDSWGRILVALFLIISGACLARTYAAHFDWKLFFKKRWLAIFPIFYISYLLVAGQNFVWHGTCWWEGIPPYRFVYTLLGIDGYIPFDRPNFYLVGEWFVGALIGCYLVFPALLWLLKHLPYTTAAVLLTVTWFIPLMPFFTGDPFQNLWTCITIFYLGMLIAQCPSLFTRNEACWISTLVMLVLLCLHIPFYPWLRLIGPILTAIAMFLCLTNLGRMCEQSETVRTALAHLGKLSYPMFLVQHVLIVRVLVHWTGYSPLSALKGLFLSIAATLFMAWVILLIHDKLISFLHAIRHKTTS